MSDSLQPHGLHSPWTSSGQNTGVGSLSLLQGIFPTQGSNPGLPHCRQILYQLSHKGSPLLLKCCTKYVSKFGKLRSGHRTGKGQSLSQFRRRAVLKNAQTTRQLHSSPMLVRLCSKSSKLGFSITWTENFQRFKLALEMEGEPEIKLPTFTGSKQGNSRKTSTSVLLTMLEPLTVWIITNCGKFLKRWEY